MKYNSIRRGIAQLEKLILRSPNIDGKRYRFIKSIRAICAAYNAVLNELYFANLTNQQLNAEIDDLKKRKDLNPLELYNLHVLISKAPDGTYFPLLKKLSLRVDSDDNKEFVDLNIDPMKVICVTTSDKGKGREKVFYYLSDESQCCIKKYYYNNENNFSKIRQILDRSQHCLIVVNRYTIVNVLFYELKCNKVLELIQSPKISLPKLQVMVDVSDKAGEYKNKTSDFFNLIKRNLANSLRLREEILLLQK